MTEAAQSWEGGTIAGFRAMGSSRYAEAAGHWLRAYAALESSTGPDDPRQAAGTTNAGVAHALLGQTGKADAALDAAERLWTRLLRRAETADVPIAVGSSSFHFRLAAENLQAFQDVQRRRFQRQCEAGLAITRFNRVAAGADPAACAAAVATLAPLLSDILGPQSCEARLLHGAAQPPPQSEPADTPYADKVADLDTPPVHLSQNDTDVWQLLGVALALTALLRPGLAAGLAAKPQDTAEASLVHAATPTSRRP